VNVLVTGGAGYIGSHMVRVLVARGHAVTVADDLSTGHRHAVAKEAAFVQANVADTARIADVLRANAIDAVLHFAGVIRVEESVSNPAKYWKGNVAASLGLLDALRDAGVTRFVFSSTAAVYGDPVRVPLDEEHPTRPVNPYGESKLAVERVLASYGQAYGLRWAALRYFNAAGAAFGLGEHHEPETHLVPIVLDVALGRREQVALYGTDWPTPDGTCVRDYIHVLDLAEAHLAALEHLARGGESGAFNLGTGRGHSVREVVETARAVTGHAIPAAAAPRRAGDPPALVAAVERAAQVLGWRAARRDLRQIVEDAWASRRGPRAG
jgi:UDP-glucose 4-epimerase